MKINSVKSKGASSRSQRGFTLIEMIGVLAVIAILAAVLIPKVFEAINNARINNTAMTCNGIKTGCIDHYAKYGTFPVDGSQTPPAALTAAQQLGFDGILLKEQLIDKPFQVKIGDGIPEKAPPDNTTTRIEILAAPTAAQVGTAVTGGDDGLYNLGGTTGNDDITGTWVVQAVITGVTLADAVALNNAIDGTSAGMGPAAVGGSDLKGRVMYVAPAAGATTTVYVYLTHR